MKDKQLPDWFNGTVYEEGATITNHFSGESYDLGAEEVSMYDLIMGIRYVCDQRGWTEELRDLNYKAEAWFKETNPEAYDILIK